MKSIQQKPKKYSSHTYIENTNSLRKKRKSRKLFRHKRSNLKDSADLDSGLFNTIECIRRFNSPEIRIKHFKTKYISHSLDATSVSMLEQISLESLNNSALFKHNNIVAVSLKSTSSFYTKVKVTRKGLPLAELNLEFYSGKLIFIDIVEIENDIRGLLDLSLKLEQYLNWISSLECQNSFIENLKYLSTVLSSYTELKHRENYTIYSLKLPDSLFSMLDLILRCNNICDIAYESTDTYNSSSITEIKYRGKVYLVSELAYCVFAFNKENGNAVTDTNILNNLLIKMKISGLSSWLK